MCAWNWCVGLSQPPGVCMWWCMRMQVLELSYWPLFRDSTYYCACLGLLAVFYGVTTPNRITWSQLELVSN